MGCVCGAVRRRGDDDLADGVRAAEPVPPDVRPSRRRPAGRHAGAVRVPGLADGVLHAGGGAGEAEHAERRRRHVERGGGAGGEEAEERRQGLLTPGCGGVSVCITLIRPIVLLASVLRFSTLLWKRMAVSGLQEYIANVGSLSSLS